MKNNQNKMYFDLPNEFVVLLDEIVEKNPDFKNKKAVIRYAVRKYYDEIIPKESKNLIEE